jgi:hypothetical protein
MKYIALLTVAFLTLVSTAPAQIPRPETDKCHVYVVDVGRSLKMQKELENARDSDYPTIEAKYKGAETLFPFEATVNEEMETTKHFPFPNSKMFVTASVYYTDEMMGSATGPDSISLGIFVSPGKPESALGLENVGNAVADIAYNALTSKVRVKHYVTVDKKEYLVGLECETRLTRERANQMFAPNKP